MSAKFNGVRFLGLIALVALMVCFMHALKHEPSLLPSARLNQPLPVFKVPSLVVDNLTPHVSSTTGAMSFFDSAEMTGRVVLLNVWASWCAACTEEQDFLNTLSRKGFVIYGLNYKDNADDAKRFLMDYGNPYYKIGQDRKGAVAMDLGVYGAPETFLIDAHGIIRYRHVGILTKSVWNKVFLPRMHSLEKIA